MNPLERLRPALADRYRIERELGAGGMATVYLAEDLKHKRKVALKVLKPELAAVLGAERFVQEITTTAALQHPHILPLFDSGTADAFLFYVMPFIDGETLRAKLDRETQLGVDEAVKITTAVADALDYAHRHGVIHRDIKPENILLHEGRPMVADFGIALAVSAAAGGRMTETGLSLGTPHYMSPEQATAEKENTARSDIYSLGSVLYEMLTGSPPHVGATAQQIIMKIVTEEAAPVTKVRKAVPPHVVAAVAQSLQKLPADRFASAAEFSAVLQGHRTIAMPAGAPAAGGSSRPSWLVGVAGAGLGALLVAAAFMLVDRRPPDTVEYWDITPPTGLDTIPLYRVFALSPDGNRMVYAVRTPEGKSMLAVRAVSEPEGTVLPGTDGAEFPIFAPDGERVAFRAPPGVVKWVRLDGGAPQTLGPSYPWLMCWGGDQQIYYTRDAADPLGTGISRVPEQGGTPEAVTTIDPGASVTAHGCDQVLPDGRGILVSYLVPGGTVEQRIGVHDFTTGETRSLLPGMSAKVIDGSLVRVGPDQTLVAVPFDTRTLSVTGPPVTLYDNLYSNRDGYVFSALAAAGSNLVVAVADPEQSLLTWVDRRGARTPIDPGNPQEMRSFALSPDERHIAVGVVGRGSEGLWTYSMPGGPWTKLVTSTNDEMRPSWSPDGNRIAFVDGRGDEPRSLWVIRADGGESPQQLRPPDPFIIQEGEWSPDGAWLVYREGPSGPTARDLVYARPHPDSARIPLAATASDEFAPTLSPDGRWLAYVTTATGREEVVVKAFPGSGAPRQVSIGGGFEPRWAHSGRELFYRDGAGDLVALDVTTGASFSLLGRRVLFSALRFMNDRNSILYDVSADDQRFLFLEVVSGGEVSWRLVRGFRQALKEKMNR